MAGSLTARFAAALPVVGALAAPALAQQASGTRAKLPADDPFSGK